MSSETKFPIDLFLTECNRSVLESQVGIIRHYATHTCFFQCLQIFSQDWVVSELSFFFSFFSLPLLLFFSFWKIMRWPEKASKKQLLMQIFSPTPNSAPKQTNILQIIRISREVRKLLNLLLEHGKSLKRCSMIRTVLINQP